MIEMFRRANEHQGASFVEIYQNCNVFNDGAFDTILNKDARPNMLIDLRHGEPIRFGADRELGVMMNEFGEARSSTSPTSARTASSCTTRHRADPSLAFALSRLADQPTTPTPVGVFRAVEPADLRGRDAAPAGRGVARKGPGDLDGLLRSAPTWSVD